MSEPLEPKDVDITIDTFRKLRDRAHDAGQTAALGEILKTMAAAERVTIELLNPTRQAPPHIRDVIQPSEGRGQPPQTAAGQQRRQGMTERMGNGGDRTLST